MPRGNSADMSLEGLTPEYLAKRAELPVCVVCERPMRPAGKRAEEWPATVSYATAEQCKTCYNRKYSKPLSVHESLKSIKPAKVAKTRRRGVEYDVLKLDLSRPVVASRWSEEERSAALQIVETGLRTEDLGIAALGKSARVSVHREAVAEIGAVMEMLGLFEAEKATPYSNLQDPKSDRFV